MADRIRFVLNDEIVELSGVSPMTTLLDWLRDRRGLKGTKEGCAEGDCGACTVVLERADGRREAINSCIALLGQIDGQAVRTVEGLEGRDGAPHAVQQAMAESDATQCGFCTPGFVMSLWACWEHHQAAGTRPTRQELADELGRELYADDIWQVFQKTYRLGQPQRFNLRPGQGAAAGGIVHAEWARLLQKLDRAGEHARVRARLDPLRDPGHLLQPRRATELGQERRRRLRDPTELEPLGEHHAPADQGQDGEHHEHDLRRDGGAQDEFERRARNGVGELHIGDADPGLSGRQAT